MGLPRGTRHELELAMRAARVVATHLKQARCGLSGKADGKALAMLIDVAFLPTEIVEVMFLAATEKKRRAA